MRIACLTKGERIAGHEGQTHHEQGCARLAQAFDLTVQAVLQQGEMSLQSPTLSIELDNPQTGHRGRQVREQPHLGFAILGWLIEDQDQVTDTKALTGLCVFDLQCPFVDPPRGRAAQRLLSSTRFATQISSIFANHEVRAPRADRLHHRGGAVVPIHHKHFAWLRTLQNPRHKHTL